ncbi:MAG: AraC family transcriptional regulator [Leptospira sp.]|nr:AraC family transcriptional regulator [Leptospira sp.]
MYDPVKDGIHKKVTGVHFSEIQPPQEFKHLIHSFWEIKTNHHLDEDFVLHVIPDSCVNILLNVLEPEIAAITMRKTEYVALNLGRSFHYSGIQLLPGMWNGDPNEIHYGFVNSPYNGNLPLVEVAKKLKGLTFPDYIPIFSDLVSKLWKEKIIIHNEVLSRILLDIDEIESVEEMAANVNLSPRQLQRKIKQSTGFSPHDLLKILRLQKSFKGNYLDHYVDQSHFIHSFKKITGYTPKEFFKHFDV